MTEALDLTRIQGFLVRGYTLPVARYLFLRIDYVPLGACADLGHPRGGADGRDVVGQARVPPNVALSFAGLRALELPYARMAGFPRGVPPGHGGAGGPARRHRQQRAQKLQAAVFG